MLVFGASMNLMIFFSMAEDDTVLDDEDEELTWEAVVRAAGVREASKKTRRTHCRDFRRSPSLVQSPGPPLPPSVDDRHGQDRLRSWGVGPH